MERYSSMKESVVDVRENIEGVDGTMKGKKKLKVMHGKCWACGKGE